MVNREGTGMLDRLKEKPKQRRSWVSKAPLKFQNILPYNGGCPTMGGGVCSGNGSPTEHINR